MLYCLQTGKTGYEKAFGMAAFDYVARRPEEASRFSETMIGFHGDEPPAIAAACDFSKSRRCRRRGGSTITGNASVSANVQWGGRLRPNADFCPAMPLTAALVLSFLMPGCAALWLGSEPIDRIMADPCAGGSALTAKLLEPGGVLIFGELHGTQELPAFFGEAVCWTSGMLPVQVGLEIAGTEQHRIEIFLASPDPAADVEALTSGPFWTDGQDGRRSRAIVTLLDRLRRLRAVGRPIEVFAFDVSDSKDIAERDRMMADSIGSRARLHPEALTMVLVGNFHARKTRGLGENPDSVPMAAYLVDAGVKVISLNHSTPAGTAWTCSSGPPPDCGSHAIRATLPLPSGRMNGIELLAEPTEEGFDGLYATPTITSSPPALHATRAGAEEIRP